MVLNLLLNAADAIDGEGTIRLEVTSEPAGAEGADAQCGGCGGDAQTNMVRVAQPDGTVVPWIEEAPPPPKKE